MVFQGCLSPTIVGGGSKKMMKRHELGVSPWIVHMQI